MNTVIPAPRIAVDYANIPPGYKRANPKLDFYAADGRYLYSSNWYCSAKHAWAHVARHPVSGCSAVAKIRRAQA